MGDTSAPSSSAATVQPTAPSCSYLARLVDAPGKFDPVKARGLGIPPGPLYGKLVRGEEVHSPTLGRLVSPSEVMGTSARGARVLIADCPTVAHLAALRAGLERELAGVPAGEGGGSGRGGGGEGGD
mmetsp:Transcript_1613/g.5895  ORF Transcript_1613/g.5895 Transcript_1613/m.5895 type:complete len:127 (+) Transcript_1613:238-618(+)